MEDDAVIRQLGSIKKDLADYNESIHNLRYDDFKSFFGEQLQQAISETSLNFSATELEKMKTSRCTKKAQCILYLRGIMDETVAAFNNDDLATALKNLNNLDSIIKGARSPCLDHQCLQSVSDMIIQVKAILDISERLRFRKVTLEKRRNGEDGMPDGAVLDRVEKTIGPLSNRWRIVIMSDLSQGGKSFTNLSQSLGLKTGHLQFHLKMLKDAGYVGNDSNHNYALTDKGATALKGINELVLRLG